MQATIVFEKIWDAIHALKPSGKFDPETGKEIMERKYKYIRLVGSSRSSKTYSCIDVYDLYAKSNLNKRLTVWRDTKTDCVKTVLEDTKKHLKNTNRWKVNNTFHETKSIITYTTGSTFEIHGTDDENTVHGLNQDAAWLNEPYDISKAVFDQIDQRTSDFILVDLNPKQGHWSDDLEKDPRCITIHSTFLDNPFCPDEQRRKILSYQPVKYTDVVIQKLIKEDKAREYDVVKNELNFSKKQINELKRCQENEFKNTAGEFNWLVYGLGLKAERPNRIFHFVEIPDEAYFKLDAKTQLSAVDWGAVDPWAILDAKYYDGALYFHERNYESENEIRMRLNTTERSQINAAEEGIVKWMFKRLGIPLTRTIVCDNNRESKIVALRKAGWEYAIAASKPKGSIIDGIDLLNNITVYYTASSVNFKYEQENYSRKKDRFGVILEEPEDANNHHMDAARYIATYLEAKGIIKNI